MFYPLARFVDRLGSDTVRLDLNDGTFRVGEETKAEAFGQPEWEAEPGDTGGEDGYRTTSLQILCGSSKKKAAAAYKRLAQELQRPTNWLLWQDSPGSEPRWIKVYRSQLPTLSYESVGTSDDPDGGEDVWQVTLEMASDPYAYGQPITLRREILNLPDDRPRATHAANHASNPSLEVADVGWAGGQRRQSAQAVSGAYVYGVTDSELIVTNPLQNPGYESEDVPPLVLTNHTRDPYPTSLDSVGAAANLQLLEPGRLEVTTPGGGACFVYAMGYNPSVTWKTVPCAPGDTVRTRAKWTATTAPINVRVIWAYYDAAGSLKSNGAYSAWVLIPAGQTRIISTLDTAPSGAASCQPIFYLADGPLAEITPAGVTGIVGEFFTTVNQPLPARYFDGDTPQINGTYTWAATPHQSASIGTLHPHLAAWWATPADAVQLLPDATDWPGKMGRQSAALRRAGDVPGGELTATPTAAPVEGVQGSTPTRARLTVGRSNPAGATVTGRLEAHYTDEQGGPLATHVGPTMDLGAATTLTLDQTAPALAVAVNLDAIITTNDPPDVTNLINNPSCRYDVRRWNGYPTGSNAPTLAWAEGGGLSITAGGTGSTTTYVAPFRTDGAEFEPIAAGQTAYLRAKVTAVDSGIGTFIRIWYYDSAKKSLGSSEVIRENYIMAGETRTVELTSVAPENAAYGIPRIHVASFLGDAPPGGTVMQLNYAALVLDQPLDPDNWDGDTPDTDTFLYRWTGEANASPSVKSTSETFRLDKGTLALNEFLLDPFDGDTEPRDGFRFEWSEDAYASPSFAIGDPGLMWEWSTQSLGDLWLPEGWAEDDPGQLWTLSAWVGTTTSAAEMAASVQWLDSNGESLGTVGTEWVTVPDGSTTRVAVTHAPPAGSQVARFRVTGRPAEDAPPRPFLDAVMFEQAPEASGYQDGDSAGWAWLGTPGLSTSGPISPYAGRPAHAVLDADTIQGDGPAEITLRLTPSAPWHVIEPLIQVTAFESPGQDVAPLVIDFGADATVQGFGYSSARLWVDVDRRLTWANMSNVRWVDL